VLDAHDMWGREVAWAHGLSKRCGFRGVTARVRVAGEMLLGEGVEAVLDSCNPSTTGTRGLYTWMAFIGWCPVPVTWMPPRLWLRGSTDHDAWGSTREGGNGRRGRRFGSRWAEPTESRAGGEDKQVESEKGWA